MKKSLVIVTAVLLAACTQESTQNTVTTDTNTSTAATTSAATPQPVELKDGLQTPESVYYDAEQDVYFISNINGQPLAADNNGYISRVNPDTMQGEKFIEAGKANVKLDAPKGMAVMGNTLYVADINVVRKFDRKTGAPQGEVKIPGATFLNDMATDGKVVYVSDSGMKAGAGGNFEGTGTDAVWSISGNRATKIASGKDLNRPNGLAVVDGKVWVVTFAAKELYQLDKGKKTNVVQLPAGSLDGILHMSDGTFLISSWETNSVFRGPATGPFTEVVKGVTSPADMEYDAKRHRLLVPHFTESRVTVHEVE